MFLPRPFSNLIPSLLMAPVIIIVIFVVESKDPSA